MAKEDSDLCFHLLVPYEYMYIVPLDRIVYWNSGIVYWNSVQNVMVYKYMCWNSNQGDEGRCKTWTMDWTGLIKTAVYRQQMPTKATKGCSSSVSSCFLAC